MLLSLLQQLGYDLSRDSMPKLAWIRDAALALDPQVCAGQPLFALYQYVAVYQYGPIKLI